jgi:hypothetical protein
MDAIESTASNFRDWMTDYYYDKSSNEYVIKEEKPKEQHCVEDWFKFGHQVGARKIGVKYLSTIG